MQPDLDDIISGQVFNKPNYNGVNQKIIGISILTIATSLLQLFDISLYLFGTEKLIPTINGYLLILGFYFLAAIVGWFSSDLD